MDALAGHARALSELGGQFAGTGERVHASWQGLAGVYEAPEAAQLLAATGPVQLVSASVGEDITAVGAALAIYAAEVREIQAALDALRAQASEFVGSVQGDGDWREDQGKVDRNNELVGAVNAQIAAFYEAQRRCANAINALYGGTQYRAEDGDGRVEPGEYGYTGEQLTVAAGEDGALPWGSAAERDRGLFGDLANLWVSYQKGFWVDGAWGMVQDLGALIGRDPTTGEWSWGTAGVAWTGVGTFALALGVYATPGGAVLDQTAGKGALGDTLLTAGKGLIAYDMWGQDPARAAGTTGFNIVSAVVGTKGASAGLRGAGAAAEASRVGAVSRAGTALVRSGEFLAKLPTTDEVAAHAVRRFPGFHVPDLSTTPRVQVPHHVDVPTAQLDLPTGTRGIDTPTPGTVGDNLSRTPDTPDAPAGVPHSGTHPDAPASEIHGGPAGEHAGSSGAPTHAVETSPDAPHSDRTPDAGDHTRADTSPSDRSLGAVDRPAVVNWNDLTNEQKIHVAESEVFREAVAFRDNSDAARYGANHWNEYVEKLPPSEKQAIYDYTMEGPHTGPTYREINGHLRGNATATPDVLHHISEIDKAMERNPVPEDLVVTRGTNLSHMPIDPPDMVGQTFPERSYLSTSLGGPASGFADKDAILHLRVPKGTPALWTEKVSAFGGGERELLLARGLSYRVDRVVRYHGQWQIYGEIVPK